MGYFQTASKLSSRRNQFTSTRKNKIRPAVEGLEDRLLLYAATGDVWSQPVRVTYSFMPDGTSIGGVPSTLFSTLSPDYSTAAWQGIVAKAAASWENVANVNFAQVSDDGSPVNSGNLQQGATNFGDIRIGAAPLQSGVLAETFMPPAANGGSIAGDMIFNSNVNWSPSNGYDLLTVAVHEFGHTVSLGESTVTSAVMYQYYEGVRTTLTSDDINGAQSAFSARPSGTNTSPSHASPIALNANGVAVVTGQQIASYADQDWYSVVVPSNTTGTMTVTLQSSNLSSLEPRLTLYNSSAQGLAQASTSSFGGTAAISLSGVSAGQTYYIRVTPNTNGAGSAGAYGLSVTTTSTAAPSIPTPNTAVAVTASQGGGATDEKTTGTTSSPTSGGGGGLLGGLLGLVVDVVGGLLGLVFTSIGDVSGWAEDMRVAPAAEHGPHHGPVHSQVHGHSHPHGPHWVPPTVDVTSRTIRHTH